MLDSVREAKELLEADHEDHVREVIEFLIKDVEKLEFYIECMHKDQAGESI